MQLESAEVSMSRGEEQNLRISICMGNWSTHDNVIQGIQSDEFTSGDIWHNVFMRS